MDKVQTEFIVKAYAALMPDARWFTLEDTLYVFDMYFSAYEDYTGHSHPNLCIEQLQAIIKKMPYCEAVISGISNTLKIVIEV